MRDILTEIVAYKRKEIAEFKRFFPERQLYPLVETMTAEQLPSMASAVTNSACGIISEFKRRSPSKGWIRQEAKADVVPLSYQQQGAAAVSILTDTQFFGGYDEFVQMARLSGVTIPILYKNFVIDEYQIFQARQSGASAVLLIAAILAKDEYRSLLQIAHSLGMEVLLEMHDEHDLEYAAWAPDLYGINNRDLTTFRTDIQRSLDLVEKLPEGVCKVSESGITDAATVKRLQAIGFNGFLMGETFMKAIDPGQALNELIKQL